MSTSGNSVIAAIVTSPGTPVAKRELSAAVLSATTRSGNPNTFHATKVLLAAKRGLRMRVNPRRGDSDGDIAKPRRPGEDAGQHAVHVQGQESQSSESPRLYPRHETKVSGQNEFAERPRHPEPGKKQDNRRRCPKCDRDRQRPGRTGERPACAQSKMSANQAASTIATVSFVPPKTTLGWAERDMTAFDTRPPSIVTCIVQVPTYASTMTCSMQVTANQLRLG